MHETLLGRFEDLIWSDEKDYEEQSEILLAIYDKADAGGKKLIDSVFICVCGYSMATLKRLM